MHTNTNALTIMSKVPALRVACAGEEQAGLKHQPVTTYNLPLDHELFTQGQLSVPSQALGMPLLITKLRPSMVQPRPSKRQAAHKYPGPKFSSADDAAYFPNPAAEILMADSNWYGNAGSVLIARADKLPLQLFDLQVSLRQGYCADRPKIDLLLACINAYQSFALTPVQVIVRYLQEALHGGSLTNALNPAAFTQYYNVRKEQLSAAAEALENPAKSPTPSTETRVDTPTAEDSMEVDEGVQAWAGSNVKTGVGG